MLLQMPNHIFEEWIAYERLEPFGYIAENYRAALICAVLANTHSKHKYTPADFMPKRKKSSKEMEALLLNTFGLNYEC